MSSEAQNSIWDFFPNDVCLCSQSSHRDSLRSEMLSAITPFDDPCAIRIFWRKMLLKFLNYLIQFFNCIRLLFLYYDQENDLIFNKKFYVKCPGGRVTSDCDVTCSSVVAWWPTCRSSPLRSRGYTSGQRGRAADCLSMVLWWHQWCNGAGALLPACSKAVANCGLMVVDRVPVLNCFGYEDCLEPVLEILLSLSENIVVSINIVCRFRCGATIQHIVHLNNFHLCRHTSKTPCLARNERARMH